MMAPVTKSALTLNSVRWSQYPQYLAWLAFAMLGTLASAQTVTFDAATSSTLDEATALEITVTLSTGAPLGADLTVDVSDLLTGTASSNTDYTTFGTQSLTFTTGSTDGTTQVATLTPTQDVLQEGDETVDFVLQNVSGGSLGSTTTHTATINEDDCVCDGGDLGFVRFEPMSIDGDMTDWKPIFDDPDNNVCDGGLGTIPPLPDRDVPGGSGGRDLIHFAFTWDLTSIYFFTRRAASANPNTHFIYYVDENNDTKMDDGETVIDVIWSGASSTVSVDIYDYVTSVPGTPDDMVDGSGFADGYTMPGTMTFVAAGPTGQANAAGDEMEFSFTWASIGVTPQHAFSYHVTVDNTFPPGAGGGVDNAGGCDGGLGSTQFAAPMIEPDASSEYNPSETIYLAKVVSNDGNDSDTINLTWSSAGAHTPDSVTFYDDADSSGDFSVGDTVLTDTDGDSNPDTGSLPLFTDTDILVEYVINAAASGTAVVTLTASSSFSPTGTEIATDTLFPKPSVTFVSDASTTAESGSLDITLSLDFPIGGSLTQEVVVDITDLGTGTAISATDYTSIGSPATVTFALGSGDGATQTLSISITSDSNVEGDETIDLQITSISGPANIGATSNHAVTITDDDTATIAFVSGSSATTDEANATHPVALVVNTPPGGAIHVPITIDIIDGATGTATSAVDYTAIGTQTVTFSAFSADGSTITGGVDILQDLFVEYDETLTLTLSNPGTLATLSSTTQHVVTITDDDSASVQLQTSTSSVTEPNADQIVLVLSTGGALLGTDLTVDIVDLLSGTATNATDYTAFGTTTVTFSSGATDGSTEVATLSTLDDSLVEVDETVEFRLQNPSPILALGSTTLHTATIQDDETVSISFSAANSSVSEANTTHDVVAVLTATGTLQDDLIVDVRDLGTGTALSGTDFSDFGSPVTLTFSAGAGNGDTENVPIGILEDSLIEGDETIELRLENVGTPGSLTGPTNHTLTISDDEFASVAFSAATSATASESGTLSVVVTLTTTGGGTLQNAVTVDVNDLLSGTADANTDYTYTSPTNLNFPAGSGNGTTSAANIAIIPDTIIEGNQTINLNLSTLAGAASFGAQTTHTATITDDEFADVEFALAASSVVEANTTHSVVVLLNLTPGASLLADVTVTLDDLISSTASAAADFASFGPLTFTFTPAASNGDTQSANITILDDLLAEGTEFIDLALSAPNTPLTLGATSLHQVSILDPETPEVNFQAATSASGTESGTHNVVVAISIAGGGTLGTDATVEVIDLGTGTATASTDYTVTSPITLTFTTGSADGATQVVPLSILSDTLLEGDETVQLQLQNPSGSGMILGLIATNHEATITDDETGNFAFTAASSSLTEANTTHVVRVELNVSGGGSLAVDQTVDLANALTGSASPGTDYTLASPITLTFAAGAVNGDTQTISIVILDDSLVELAETIDLQLQNPSSAVTLGAPSTHQVTINDDETASVAFQAATAAVGESAGAASIVIVLTATGTLQDALTVDVSDLLSGTATVSTDYTFASPDTVTFLAGSGNATTQTSSISVLSDTLVEGDETIDLSLGNLLGAASLGAQTTHELTITDDEFADLEFQAATSSVVEANTTHSVVAVLNVTPGATLGSDVTVVVDELGSSTATSNSDYATFGPLILTFSSGSANGTTNSFDLTILDDLLAEGTEFIDLDLSTPSAPLTLGATTFHQVSIGDPETPEVDFVAATSASGVESGTLNVVLVVTVAGGGVLGTNATVEVADVGTGSATSATDYTALAPIVVTIPAGSVDGSTHYAPLAIIPDNLLEGNETVDLQLQNPSGAGLILGAVLTTHTATITDDETANITFQAATSSLTEAATTFEVILTLNVSSGGTLLTEETIDVSDAGSGTATSNTDYATFATATATFPANSVDGDTQVVSLIILDDTLIEGNETIHLLLANPSAPVTLGAQTTHGITITDGETGSFSFQAPTSNVAEAAGSGGLVIVLTTTGGGTLATAATVDISDLLSGTATLGTDYTFSSPGTVTFPAGAGNTSTRIATVTILDDLITETDETVQFLLNSPSSPITIGAGNVHAMTILDDETAVVAFQAATSSLTEATTTHDVVLTLTVGNGGSVPAGFTVTLTDLLTGTAAVGSDYSAFGSPVSFVFPPGATDGDTQTQPIRILDDATPETNETIDLRLSAPSTPVELGASNHTVTIQDDDFEGFFSFQTSSSATSDEASTFHYVAIEMTTTGGSPAPVDLVVNIIDAFTGLATSDTDYTALSVPTQVTFAAGSPDGSTQVVAIAIIDDPDTEGYETIDIQIDTISGPGSLGSTTAHTITITDDDGPFIDFVGRDSSVAESAGSHQVAVQLIIPAGGLSACEAIVQVVDAGTGTASAADFSAATPLTLTFPTGTISGTQQVIPLTIIDDLLAEGDETVDLQLLNLTPACMAIGAPTSHQVTILDDENPGQVNMLFLDSQIEEDNVIHFVAMILTLDSGVRLGNEIAVDITDQLTGSATSGADYNAMTAPTVLTFPTGRTNGAALFIPVTIREDFIGEGDETIDLYMSNISGPGLLGSQTDHQVTILDDDGSVFFQSSTSTVVEGGVVHMVNVELDTPTNLLVAGSAQITDILTGTATTGADYTSLPSPTTVVFPVGSADGSTQIVPIFISDDLSTEGPETIRLRLTGTTNLRLEGQTNHVVTITDNEPDPSVSFSVSTAAETEANASVFITVKLTVPIGTLGNPLSLSLTDQLTGTATRGVDYAAIGTPETLTFPPGSADCATLTYTMSIFDDFFIEGTETVELLLSNSSFGVIGGTPLMTLSIVDTGTATIGFQTASSSVTEANTSHQVVIALNITGGVLTDDLVIQFTDLATGSATSPTDYGTITPQTFTFPSGTGLSQTTTTAISINDDIALEGDETIDLGVAILSGFATPVTTQHAVTISDNETPAEVDFQFALSWTPEGDPVHFVGLVLTIPGPSPLGNDVLVEITDQLTGTATSSSDYTTLATPVVLTFPTGASSGHALFMPLNPVDDLIGESDETVNLLITNVSGPGILGVQTDHTVTIVDDDTSVSFAIGSSSAAESGGNHTVVVTLSTGVNLSTQATVEVTDLLTGSATNAADYTSPGTTILSFSAGSTDGATQTLTIPILSDLSPEVSETINLALQNPTGEPSLGDSTSHVVTITDDDIPTVSFQSAATTAGESGGGHSLIVLLTTPGGPTTTALTVQISDLLTGTATSATDYTAFPPTILNFPPGSANGATQVATLTVLDDTDDESDETVNLRLASASGGPNATLGTITNQVVTIADNDGLEVTKSVSATDQPHTSGTVVTIGEIITYQYTVNVPESASPFNLRSTDTLPSELTYQTGTVSVTTGHAGMTIASTATSWTQPTLQVDLTTVSNLANGNGTDDFLTITYQALVANTANNEAGQAKTNTVQVTDFTDTVSDSATVTLVEPDISLTKAASNITRCDGVASLVHLGDVLEYTLVVTETNGIDAFDLSITDALDEGLAYDTSFAPTVTGTGNTIGAASTSGTGGVGDPQTITWSLALGNADIDIQPSSSVTIIYRVTVLASATPSATLNNTATAGISSTDGANTNERSNASAPGALDYEAQATNPVSVKPAGTTHSIPNARRRTPTFIDADGNITGPGGPAVLTADDELSLTDGSGVTITGDGISTPPPSGAPDITVVASAAATIITDGTASFEYGVVTINTDATLTLTGDTTINFEQIVMASGSTLILPDGSTLTITGPCELNGGVGTSNYVTIQAAGSGPLSINFSCTFTGDHFVIEDIGTGTITFSGDTQIDYAIFRDGSGSGPYIQYDDDDDVTWTNLAFECTKTTIQTGSGSGNVTVDNYAQTIATRWCGGESTDSENGGTITWLNATPVRKLSGSLSAPDSGGIQLSWQTAQETMLSHFDIERRLQTADHFHAIGRVFPTAEEFGDATYTFLDPSPTPGQPYHYRITAVDSNGSQHPYPLGNISATANKAATITSRGGRSENIPAATDISVTTPDYQVATYAVDTPAMAGTGRKATITQTGLYYVPGKSPVYSAGHRLARLGDGFVFARQLADYYTDQNAIWTGSLQIDGSAQPLPQIQADATYDQTGYRRRVRTEANQSFSINAGLPAGPNWYYSGRIQNDASLDIPLLADHNGSGLATMTLAVSTSLDEAHQLNVTLNGVYLGTANWSAKGHRQVSLAFDASLLQATDNTATLTTRAGAELRLDWIDIEATTAPTPGSTITIHTDGQLPTGAATYAVDITTTGQEQLLPIQGGHVSVTAGQILHLAQPPQTLSWSDERTLVIPSLGGVAYIAVAPAHWLPLLQPIIAKHGLPTLLISIEDVHDTFGAGRFGPAGLVTLTQRAQARYLLLGASTTYDYKNYEGRDTPAGIPTGWVQVLEGMAASDDLYTNNLTTAVGRLPARSSSELATMVNKIASFEPASRVLLLPDRNDLDGDIDRFTVAQQSVQNLLPTVLIDTEDQTDAQVRTDMIAAMQAGARVVAYQGHAGFQEIGESFVNTGNVSDFPTSAWFLSTCLSGSYFINTNTATLARSLLNTPTGGGALVIASTRFGHAEYEHYMIEQALPLMAAGEPWGDILNQLKRNIDHETLTVFQLFGDPATAATDLTDSRQLLLRSPQGGTVHGSPISIQFSLAGDAWWDETVRISYRTATSPWLLIRELQLTPGQTDYTIDWSPPADGTGYQIKLEVVE